MKLQRIKFLRGILPSLSTENIVNDDDNKQYLSNNASLKQFFSRKNNVVTPFKVNAFLKLFLLSLKASITISLIK